MKKYHQLLLLILSVVSLSLFLVYRHEYNRLHYVLEVFNFFGQPCNFSELTKSEKVFHHPDWGPEPVWQEVENGYIYSAFLTGNVEVKAIALQANVKNVPRSCYLWFDERKKPKPVVGKFKFSKINNEDNNSLNFYFYYCSSPPVTLNIVPSVVPYAVSFTYKQKRESDIKKILLTNILEYRPVNVNTTICVSPSMYNKKRLLEFLSFHKLIGINTFIFYNKDIPYRISKVINNLSEMLSINATFLPWNYPKGENPQTRFIVENDCLFRTRGQTNYVITLEINEYVVPRTEINFDLFLKNVAKNSERLSLPVQKFCIDYMDTKKPIALQNFEVSDDYSFNVVRHVYRNTQPSDVVSTNAIDKAQASIHKYIRCNMDPQKTHSDRSMQRFAIKFMSTAFVQLLIHDEI